MAYFACTSSESQTYREYLFCEISVEMKYMYFACCLQSVITFTKRMIGAVSARLAQLFAYAYKTGFVTIRHMLLFSRYLKHQAS